MAKKIKAHKKVLPKAGMASPPKHEIPSWERDAPALAIHILQVQIEEVTY